MNNVIEKRAILLLDKIRMSCIRERKTNQARENSNVVKSDTAINITTNDRTKILINYIYNIYKVILNKHLFLKYRILE